MKKIAFPPFLQNYYLTNFFYDFIFAYAIYGALFIIRGLSVFQVSLLLAWWALTSAIFEIPSGALADRWSRKKMMVLAPLIKSFCFISWFFARGNFYLYALGFLFWSLGSCFLSGTSEALLFDVLVYFKKDKEYEKYLGKKKAYLYLAVAISMITSGIMANFNLNFTIIFSVIPLIFSAFFATRIYEAAKVKSTEEVHYFEYLKMAFREVKNNKLLRYLFLYLFGISTLNGLEEFDQLYYQLVKLPLFSFGLVGFLWSFFNAIGTYYAYKLKNHLSIFYLLPLVSAFLLFLVGRYPVIPMIVVLLLSYFMVSPLSILIEGKIQKNIKSLSRATVISMSTFFVNIYGVFLMPLFGMLSKIWNLRAIYFSTSLFLLIFALWVFLSRKRIFENGA